MTRIAFIFAALGLLAPTAAAQSQRVDPLTMDILRAIRSLEARVKALERRIK